MSRTQIISICLTGIALAGIAASCKLQEEKIRDGEAWQKKLDSTGNALLDSVYKLESLRCDSIQKMRLGTIVDSMIQADSSRQP